MKILLPICLTMIFATFQLSAASVRPWRAVPFNPAEAVFEPFWDGALSELDQWSLEKKAMLEGLGCDVEVMWQRTDAERLTSGTEVRDLIRAGQPWAHLVPPFVYKYMTSHGIDLRLRGEA